MLAVPDATFGVGVNVAVRRVPVPMTLPNVPPLTLTSPAFEAHVKLLPGSSLKVKVMVAVSPVFKVAVLEVMANDGAKVSMLILGVTPALPVLPAVSV